MAGETYQGACHCGAVSFSVDLDLAGALKCNCSICTKLGAVWAFAPKSNFALKSGAAQQGDYQFGKKSLHHRFCTSCGIESYAEGMAPDGTATVGINLRCLEGVEVEKLTPRPFDGRSK
ncbi:MAG: GFA family protein [Alphaproteobacteria bacterium]|nr:GFA family protein [Alphaproteobacteria bacterium]